MTEVDIHSNAYRAGYNDGLVWDYDEDDIQPDGWDDATLNAMGALAFGFLLGLTPEQIEDRGAAWRQALTDYNQGCVDGAKASRE